MYPTTKEHLRRSIVRIQGKSRGTGFWIKGKDGQVYVLTCAHVAGVTGSKPEVRFYKSAELFGGPEEAIIADVLISIPENEGDIALLTLPSDFIPGDILPLQLLDVYFEEPPPFIAYGFPAALSEHGRFADGKVGSVISSNEAQSLCQLQEATEIRKGFSGSPIVHSDLGYVLGMVSDQEKPDDTSSASIPYSLSARFIGEKLLQYLEVQTLHPYQAWLSSLYHEVVLNDDKGMRLTDVYVEPHYGIHESCVEKDKEPYKGQQTKGGFFPVEDSVHDLIMETLSGQLSIQDKPRNPQLTLLLGYPGQGKTSFTKRLIHDYIVQQPDRPVYLVRLRYIADPKELQNNPFPVLEKEIKLQAERKTAYAVPEINIKNALLILDGLDELCIKSDMNSQDVDDIVKEISRNAEQHPGLRIVLTSRYGYVNLQKLFDRNILILQLAELTPEQQLGWLEQYSAFHPETHLDVAKLEIYNHEDQFEALSELITQPILLHMVATLEEDLSDAVNRAAIYSKLFDQLVQRPWSKEGNIEALKGINPDLLRGALQDMAHAIFHSDKGYLYKSALDNLPKVKELQRALDNKLDVWRSVMVAFYMDEVRKGNRREQEDDRDHDYAIEFLHKSLPEYLCAEKIWRGIIEEFLETKPKKPERDLESLYELFGKKIITQEIVQYLIEIIRNDEELDKPLLIQRLTHFLQEFLDRDFLSEAGKNNPLDIICAVFYGYWTVLHSLREGGDYFSKERFLRLLRTVLDIGKGTIYINLSGANLSDANLSSTNLSGANLKGANLKGANLVNANLEEAYLGDANLERANLSCADLSSAYLYNANLLAANLYCANLHGVELNVANLAYAKLEDANFGYANLSGADLFGADLFGANLSETNLSETIFDGAILSHASLDGAKHLTIGQLKNVRTLFKCTGIPPKIESQLRQTHPHLFEDPTK